MKKKYVLGALVMASLAFTGCSSDEIAEDLNQVTPETSEDVVDNGFTELGNFEVATQLGNTDESTGEYRTPFDIDGKGRPSNVYPLKQIGLLSLHPTVQPVKEVDEGFLYDPKYDNKPGLDFINVEHGFKVYYKLEDITDNSSKQCSNSGRIVLSTNKRGDNAVSFNLSVFNLSDLHSTTTDHIQLNSFAYGKGVEGNLRGDALRYVSYDPQGFDFDQFDMNYHSRIAGYFAELPTLTDPKFDFLKGDPKYDVETHLVGEFEDRLFAGEECLFAADNDKIYMMETVPEENSLGGYYIRSTYPTSEGYGKPASVNLKRLTTIVNVSFMLVDQDSWNSRSYFVKGDRAKTLKNYKKRFGVDLSDLSCPHATFDGFNSQFFLNEYQTNAQKTQDPARMVMWSEGYEVTAANGKTIEKNSSPSMDIYYNQDDKVQRGYGIKGNSYVVAFEGPVKDTKNQQINFYTNVDGAKVKITAQISPAGMSFHRNYAHHVIVFVDAKSFADAVIKHRANRGAGNDYAEVNVSADNVVVVK